MTIVVTGSAGHLGEAPMRALRGEGRADLLHLGDDLALRGVWLGVAMQSR
jgi:hypothetical protein